MNKIAEETLENIIGGAQRVVRNNTVGYANVRCGSGKGCDIEYMVSNGDCVFTTGRV